MFLRRIFKGMPDMGPWVAVAELFAAMATVLGTLMALHVVPNPLAGKVSSGVISGVVGDVRTGRPVPEATVQIIDSASKVIAAEAIPDKTGNWRETVKPGVYVVKAVCDGYHPAEKSVSVLEGKSRIVQLSIREQSEAQTGGGVVSKTVVIERGPSQGAAMATAARTSSAGQPSAQPAVKKENPAEQFVREAKQLSEQGKYREAEDALVKALKCDPTDGRFYASLIRLNLYEDYGSVAAARGWAEEGRQNAKKNKAKMEEAIKEIGIE